MSQNPSVLLAEEIPGTAGIDYEKFGFTCKFLPEPGDNCEPPPTYFASNGLGNFADEEGAGGFIASEENPVTAQVMVNRIWYQHFGKGIVSTPSNFGKTGTKPTNPELPNWLATEFMRPGWSIKQMHRLIMNSETYKMASAYHRADNAEKDPTNQSLWRFLVKRLDGEIIRDITLSASGQLNRRARPAVMPSGAARPR